MSWISDLTGRAETFLNQLDQGAASVLKEDDIRSVETPKSRSEEIQNEAYFPASHNDRKLQIVHEEKFALKTSKSSSKLLDLKDRQDDHLIEFLNGTQNRPELQDRGGVNIIELETQQSNPEDANGSNSPGSFTDQSSIILMETESNGTWDSSCNSGRDSRSSVENSSQDNQDFSRKHEVQEDCDNLVSWKMDLATENKMLKREISSLNQETTRVLARTKQAEKDFKESRSQYEIERKSSQNHLQNLRAAEEHITTTERIGKDKLKDMKMDINEKEQENFALQGQLSALLADNQRQLSESQDISGVQSQAILAMEERIREAEQKVREKEAEIESFISNARSIETSFLNKIKGLEWNQQNMKAELAVLQKEKDYLKLTVAELNEALGTSKAECVKAQKELIDYRTKAQRILHEKENFILQLKEGIIVEGQTDEDNMLEAELKQIIKERDLCQEEASKFSAHLQETRQELVESEQMLQKEIKELRDRENQLSLELQGERVKREEIEGEASRIGEEVSFLRDDLTRAKASQLTQIQEKESELRQLRNHITIKERTPDKYRDAEVRIKRLTDDLILRQSQLETLNSEKNTMVYKIEYLENKVAESLGTIRSRKNGPNIFDEGLQLADDRRPLFLQESPFDGTAVRQVKRAYTGIDKLSVRIGIALRRYPVARICVLFYMIVLHFWVFLVLLTQTPDTGIKDMKVSQQTGLP